MSDFSLAWRLSRQRLEDEIGGLTDAQLRWKLHENALSIGEMALHVAGVEISFASQLTDRSLSAEEAKLRRAATEGVVNDAPFPFDREEITADAIASSLSVSKGVLAPIIEQPSEALLMRQIESALGPLIDGKGAFARLAFHSAYHQGQAYLYKTSPQFPRD